MGMRMHREMSGAENGYEKVGNGYEDIEREKTMTGMTLLES